MKNLVQFFPIVGEISDDVAIRFREETEKISFNSKFISYITSPGGNMVIAKNLAKIISTLPVESIAIGGSIIHSSAALIFCSYKERFAFRDSNFLFHKSKYKNNIKRDYELEKFDEEILFFLYQKLNIKEVELNDLVKKGKPFNSKKALEIGLIKKVFDCSYKNFYWNNQKNFKNKAKSLVL